MRKLIDLVRANLVVVGMVTIMSLIAIGALLTWLNKRKIKETTELRAQAEEIKERLDMIFSVSLRQIDLGLRGYALTKKTQLLNPMNSSIRTSGTNLRKLDSLLRVQHLDSSVVKFQNIKKGVLDYIAFSVEMKKMVEQDSMRKFSEMLNQDKGNDLWRIFGPFNASHVPYENAIIQKAQEDYEAALNRNVIIQVILLLLGLPSLSFVIYATRKELKERRNLIQELEENNRKFLFHPGNESTVKGLRDVIANSIGNFKSASEFVKAITSKNYSVQWNGLDQTNSDKNVNTLAGELAKMRDQMIVTKQEDEKRFWTNEGLTKFSELVRNHQADLTKLSDEATKFLAHYLKAQQGSLFIINDDDEKHKFLDLAACYAFDKKKYLTKRVEMGDGLIGQTYLEGEAILIKEVPPDYIEISSGLGHAKPTCLCIIPLKYNEKIEAVLELASFHFFEPYQVDFLQKAGEFIASAIVSAKVSSRMKVLLEQSQQQSEEMHAQEEEMRQNMEELQATQEEMTRKGREMEDLLNRSNEKEEAMKMKLKEIEKVKRENDDLIAYMQKYKTTLLNVLDQLPHKVFLKDKDGKMAIANTVVAKAHNMSVDQLIGKSDFDFVDAKTAQEWRDQELAIIKKGSETYIFDETLKGKTKTLKSTKMAFFIPHLNQTGLLGIQTDVTELEELKKQVEEKKKKSN